MRNTSMTLIGARRALRVLLVPAGLVVLLSPGLAASTGAPVNYVPLTDTGITYSSDGGSAYALIHSGCPSTDPPGQDCFYGRDAAALAGTLQKIGGSGATNGFDYTKISNSGNALAASTALGSGPNDWACTRDNVTGLIWEVKTTDGGTRDQKWTYTWFDDTTTDGDYGVSNGGTCYLGAGCDTQSYVATVNASGLCGASNWRLPGIAELMSIDNFGLATAPMIDTTYFPNTPSASFWTMNSYSGDYTYAWVMDTNGGYLAGAAKSAPSPVRLVRSGP